MAKRLTKRQLQAFHRLIEHVIAEAWLDFAYQLHCGVRPAPKLWVLRRRGEEPVSWPINDLFDRQIKSVAAELESDVALLAVTDDAWWAHSGQTDCALEEAWLRCDPNVGEALVLHATDGYLVHMSLCPYVRTTRDDGKLDIRWEKPVTWSCERGTPAPHQHGDMILETLAKVFDDIRGKP